MLLGIYKSFEELEENLTIEELHLILKADREREDRNHRVLAAVNGIDWGGTAGQSAEDAVEAAKRRAEAKLEAESTGRTEEQVELESMGIKFA